MADFFQMPKLGLTMTDGVIVKWLKNEGDRIEAGEDFVEVETDKTNNVEASKVSGTVLKLLFEEGESVPILTKIAVIGEPGEAIPALDGEPEAQRAITMAPPAEKSAPKADAPSAGKRVDASPIARRLAGEKGIDLALVFAQTGARVEKEDVLRHEQSLQARAIPVASAATAAIAGMSGMRRGIAATLTLSKTTIPHFYLEIEVNMAKAAAARERYNQYAAKSGGDKLAYDVILAKAAAIALQNHPKVNRTIEDGAILERGASNIALAVALDDGLLVPVIKGVEAMRLPEIAKTFGRLIEKARAGALQTSECADGVLTISNLGKYDVRGFTAIINPPQSTILAIGNIADRPIVIGGGLHIAPVMSITASFDHRIIDGAVGAAFMRDVKAILENPEDHIDFPRP